MSHSAMAAVRLSAMRYALAWAGVSSVATCTGTSASPIALAAFQRVWPTTMTPSPSTTIGCLNPNSRIDLATANNGPNNDVSVVLSLGDGTFGPALHFQVGNGPADIVAGNTVRIKLGYAALASNKDQMKGLPLPDDWSSFATPPKSWDERIAYVDPRGSSVAFMVLAALVQNYGEEKTRAIYRGLKDMHSEVSMNTPGSVAKLVSGERPLMMYILTNHLGDALRKGAPVEFKIPASGAIPFYFSAGVLKNARHPNAAKLYLEFLLDQGQDVIISRGEYALRNGAPAPQGLPPLDKTKLMRLDLTKALADQKKLIAWWQEVTGIQ